jgi:hypothetical protein
LSVEPGYVRADATHLYVTEPSNGTVSRVPIGGGPIVHLAEGQQFPYGLALDATHV